MLWFENPNQIQLNKVKVYDMQGRLVSSFVNVEESVCLSELKSGIYFVKISKDKIFQVLKK